MKKNQLFFLSFLVLAAPLFFSSASAAQTDAQATTEILETLVQSMNNLSRMISATRDVMKSPDGIGREKELQARLDEFQTKLQVIESSFEQLSAGIGLDALQKKEEAGVNWNRELTEFLAPIMTQVKKMTSRPRQIEALRNEIAQYNSQLQMTQAAQKRLISLVSQAGNPQLIEKLGKLTRSWENQENELRARMAVSEKALEKAMGEKKSIVRSFQELLEFFFQSRGRNLFLAFLAFVVIWSGLYYLHKLIFRLSPFHKKGRSFGVRVFDLFYRVFTVFISAFVLLGTLYFLGDWLLLSLAIIFVMGIAWASKQALPRFWNQAALMLNFGAVREGEVVVYKGIPYEVASINMNSKLENKALENGFVRLRINDLMELRSRPITENEPWFPSRTGEWVHLADGTYGSVAAQTPEMVTLKLKGGALKYYTTSEYLAQSPTNLSNGYRLTGVFGLDYQHQRIATDEIPEIIQKSVTEALEKTGHGPFVERIRVEFKAAGASSLDMAILAEFNGKAGSKYWVLERAIQKICVDVCNQHNWVIPFQQVSVHMAGS
ncbi:MAG: hypothetical protein JRD04_02295 [Deltaproteobacteria bacterium]|nr:hypothetical protein [Deltaproteobacteria bacterium]